MQTPWWLSGVICLVIDRDRQCLRTCLTAEPQTSHWSGSIVTIAFQDFFFFYWKKLLVKGSFGDIKENLHLLCCQQPVLFNQDIFWQILFPQSHWYNIADLSLSVIKIMCKEETSSKRQDELNTTRSSRLIKKLGNSHCI